jgi:hypothetical protein
VGKNIPTTTVFAVRSIVVSIAIKKERDMKFKEFDNKKESEKTLLVEMSVFEDRIRLRAVNDGGLNLSNLIEITETGVYLYCNVDKSIGLPLDENGRLKIVCQ